VQSAGTDGAAVAGIVADGPADSAGLTVGDVITTVGGTAITSAADVSTALAGYQPGDTVKVTWTDTAGQSQSASVTLATGPAD
jgi:S1-C subfamily serine protease